MRKASPFLFFVLDVDRLKKTIDKLKFLLYNTITKQKKGSFQNVQKEKENSANYQSRDQ